MDIQEQEWPAVLSRIESVLDLDQTARALGAFGRRRQIKSAPDLLRLALAYGPGGQSLRQTAAWAELQGIASLSDVALLYRLRASPAWLAQIASALLGGRANAVTPPAGLRVRIIDASVISAPGRSHRWRLHAAYDLPEERLSAFDLTSSHDAELFERTAISSGDLMMGDRVYARAGGLHYVIDAGGDFLVRVGRRSLKLADREGNRLDLAALLDQSDEEGSCDREVLIHDGAGKQPPLLARLVLIKKPPEAAEKARKRALRESMRGSHKNDPFSLRSSEHMMLATSLEQSRASVEQLGELYRLRWRIELAFKRLKSLLNLDRLPAKDEGLAKSWILTHLIAALLIEDINPDLRDSPPSAPR